MAQDLSAGPISLVNLLKGEKEYISPLFQRQYIWGQKEINDLWDDIDEIKDGSATSRFLGALVLEVKSAGKAFEPDSVWIVDGQQRITTLFLTLLVIAQECERNDENGVATTIVQQYLLNQDSSYKNSPKLSPTLLDYSQLNNILQKLTSVHPKLKNNFGDPNGKLNKAADLILTAVRKRCSTGGTLDIEITKNYVSIILEKLKFVQIVLGDDQDPHQVFDSLNAKGIKLETKDLIRNIIFQNLSAQPEQADYLYKSKWLPIEQLLGDRFEGYFFPFALVRKSSVTKSSLLGMLRDEWKSMKPELIIQELEKYIRIYNALTSSDDDSRESLTDSEAFGEALQRLYRMNAPTSIYPFVFQVFKAYQDNNLSEQDAVQNMRLIESFLVRRAIGGIEPTGLHAVFKDLWNLTAGSPAMFVQVIDKNPTVKFPTDDEFISDVRLKPLYGRKLARYILLEYERGLDGGDKVTTDDCTIDHVMPQEMTSAWLSVINEEDHKVLKNTWANLVPLSGPANSEKGQKPWPFVKDFFSTETIFKTTKRLAHNYESWDLTALQERANSLAAWAISRWPKQI